MKVVRNGLLMLLKPLEMYFFVWLLSPLFRGCFVLQRNYIISICSYNCVLLEQSSKNCLQGFHAIQSIAKTLLTKIYDYCYSSNMFFVSMRNNSN